MFYVYRNTRDDYKVIAEFSTKNEAMSCMEDQALKDNNPLTMGYAVRDYLMNIYVEIEK
jgi:hypothetical protein